MKKLLLINPAFNIAKAKYDSSLSVGLLCLASYLHKRGVLVRIIDCARQENWQKVLEDELPATGYIGFSVMTTQIPSALQIAWQIRQKYPWIKLIWGGSHVTFFPEDSLKNSFVDFVVLNEGEATLFELIQNFEDVRHQDFSKIKGLAWKKDDKIFINEPRPLLPMAEIPLPNWELMPDEVLTRLELVPTHTSRGCPHRCAFCINAITKNRWRQRQPEAVLQDLRVIKSMPAFVNKKLRFWDENFFVDLKRAQHIIDGMIVEGLTMPWETTIRADYFSRPQMSDEFLEKLKKSGCYLLSFGAESGSPKILNKLDKDITREQILQSAQRCLRYEIIPQYSFMAGLPGETNKDMMMTVSLIDDLVRLDKRVQILGPQAFRPYPGSTLYQECLADGWQEPKGLREWAGAVENELSYLTPYQFPWVKNPDLVDSLEAYTRFGALSFESAIGSTVKAAKILKVIFSAICKLRWRLRFFKWPIEYKLAKKYIAASG